MFKRKILKQINLSLITYFTPCFFPFRIPFRTPNRNERFTKIRLSHVLHSPLFSFSSMG